MIVYEGEVSEVHWKDKAFIDTYFKNVTFQNFVFDGVWFTRCYFENVTFKNGKFYGRFEDCQGVENIVRINIDDESVFYENGIDSDFSIKG